MTATVAYDSVPLEYAEPAANAQAAIWLGTNGVFQVWTQGGWVDVAAEGVTPATGVDYTFRFVFDYRARKYSVALQHDAEWKFLAATEGPLSSATSFPLAASASVVSCVRFSGGGVFTSMTGSCAELEIDGFIEDEIVSVYGGAVQLDAAQAEWLNAFGDKTGVASACAGFSRDEFIKAYLLNLNIMDAKVFDDCIFEVTGINVEKENIEIGIRLVRPGAVKEGGVAKAINGTLRIYGARTLAGLLDSNSNLHTTTFAFGDGQTNATATIPKSPGDTFFKAVIE